LSKRFQVAYYCGEPDSGNTAEAPFDGGSGQAPDTEQRILDKKFSDLCELRGREKKSKFAGFILAIGRVIFSVAEDHPLSAVVPIWDQLSG
jgi:hypothetical protein